MQTGIEAGITPNVNKARESTGSQTGIEPGISMQTGVALNVKKQRTALEVEQGRIARYSTLANSKRRIALNGSKDVEHCIEPSYV